MADRTDSLKTKRPPGEARIYVRLEARLRRTNMSACDGCIRCATRCVSDIPITYPEFVRLISFIDELPPERVKCVLAQDKRYQWWDNVVLQLCPFLDRETDHCLVYAARPLTCRLFGFTPWMPCPTGMVSDVIPDALSIMTEYSAMEHYTLREWLRRTRIRLPGQE